MAIQTDVKVREKILEVIGGSKLVGLATIKDGKPWVRLVVTDKTDDGTMNLYLSTSLHSRKVDQIKHDDHVHLVISEDIARMDSPYVQIEARAEILSDDESKRKHWKDGYESYFKGPDDPDYCILKLEPERIELMGTGENPWVPRVWTA